VLRQRRVQRQILRARRLDCPGTFDTTSALFAAKTDNGTLDIFAIASLSAGSVAEALHAAERWSVFKRWTREESESQTC